MIWAQKTNNNIIISNDNVTLKNDILRFHSRDETAMLVYKTMAKDRSSFA